MIRIPRRLRTLLASIVTAVMLVGGLVGIARADLPEPGWGAYTPGTVAVLGRFPDLEAAGFVVQTSPGVYAPGNYDRTKFSVLLIDNWTTYENKRFVDRIISARASSGGSATSAPGAGACPPTYHCPEWTS